MIKTIVHLNIKVDVDKGGVHKLKEVIRVIYGG